MNSSTRESIRVKVLTVIGTRPEAIKLAPFVLACRAQPQVEHCLCVTGQHREMLDQVMDIFGLTAEYDLNLMRKNQELASVTAEVLIGVKEVIERFRPNWVVVQGDTTTAFAAGLAAFYAQLPLVHIEAGLRTGNFKSPWPEELNRRALGLLASLHCAPTEWAANNLRREGTPESAIEVTGNTVIDALRWVDAQPETSEALEQFVEPEVKLALESGRRIILVTGHRRENLDAGLLNMCQSLKALAQRGDVEIIFPVHLNPAVQQRVHQTLANVPHVHLTAPMNYRCFVALLRCCYMVISDSGGIQEEAPSLGKPVLVTRDTTERPEAILAGTALLVGTGSEALLSSAQHLLDNERAYKTMAQAKNPYGDGTAAQRVLTAILSRG
jgi:UDP-N-acetylglucosamine 2-epimerase